MFGICTRQMSLYLPNHMIESVIEQEAVTNRRPLSRRTAHTSLGTTHFFLSIHLPHLSCMIPCSYWTSTWQAALSSCMTLYEISVRQTRDFPVSQYVPHIQLPSDSRSPSTPLLSAISFPLPGGFGTLTRQKRAPLGAPTSALPQVAFHYHRKTGIRYIHLWLSSTFSPSDKVVTQPTGIIPDPQTNPSKTDTSTIFTSKSKSVLTCFSNFLSDKHGFLLFGSLSVDSSFQLQTKCGFPSIWLLILIFSICPYALSRSVDSSFGIPSCLSSSAFAISLASSALDGAADIFQMQHEESACVLRSMPRNPLHPYFSINHRIFFGSERNSRLPQKDSKYPFLLNLVLP